MNEMLLQVNGMTDVVFGIKDLITIVVGIVGVTTAFITLKLKMTAKEEADERRFKDIESSSEKDLLSVKEKLIEATTKKNAMRQEMNLLIEKKDAITHKRIDAVRDDLKNFISKADAEFKEVNKGIHEIKGMLTQILNQK